MKTMKRTHKKYLYLSFLLLLVTFLSYMAFKLFVFLDVTDLLWTVPNNYTECIENPKSSYNQATCSIFYTDYSRLARDCVLKGGVNPVGADGPSGCDIFFINPKFIYPEDFQECSLLVKGRNPDLESSILLNYSMCSIHLSSPYGGDKDASEKIVSKCPSSYKLENKKYGKFESKICENLFQRNEID